MIVFLLGFVPYYLFGRPSFPHRGQLVEMLYHILERLNGPLLWLVIFWVGYETRACARFIEILSDVPSVWPKSLLDREEAKTGVPRAHLDDYLDFQLIVLATAAHPLAHLPAVRLASLSGARAEQSLRRDGFPAAADFRHGARPRLCPVHRGVAAQERRGRARQGARALRRTAPRAGPAEG